MKLTKRELEVALLVCANKANKMIADEMGITIKGVEAHRRNIYDKLRVHTNLELLASLMVNGDIDPIKWAASIYALVPPSATNQSVSRVSRLRG